LRRAARSQQQKIWEIAITGVPNAEPLKPLWVVSPANIEMEATMSFGKGALLWLIGIPLPIILLIAVFMHH
jgi:hypothetical protein